MDKSNNADSSENVLPKCTSTAKGVKLGKQLMLPRQIGHSLRPGIHPPPKPNAKKQKEKGKKSDNISTSKQTSSKPSSIEHNSSSYKTKRLDVWIPLKIQEASAKRKRSESASSSDGSSVPSNDKEKSYKPQCKQRLQDNAEAHSKDNRIQRIAEEALAKYRNEIKQQSKSLYAQLQTAECLPATMPSCSLLNKETDKILDKRSKKLVFQNFQGAQNEHLGKKGSPVGFEILGSRMTQESFNKQFITNDKSKENASKESYKSPDKQLKSNEQPEKLVSRDSNIVPIIEQAKNVERKKSTTEENYDSSIIELDLMKNYQKSTTETNDDSSIIELNLIKKSQVQNVSIQKPCNQEPQMLDENEALMLSDKQAKVQDNESLPGKSDEIELIDLTIEDEKPKEKPSYSDSALLSRAAKEFFSKKKEIACRKAKKGPKVSKREKFHHWRKF